MRAKLKSWNNDLPKLRESLETMASFSEIDVENEEEFDAAMALYVSLFPDPDERQDPESVKTLR